MKIEKKMLAGASEALGKMVSRLSPVTAHQLVLITGRDGIVLFSTTDGVELVTVELSVELESAFTTLVSFAELKEGLRNGLAQNHDHARTVSLELQKSNSWRVSNSFCICWI